jgi:hypothetical protein
MQNGVVIIAVPLVLRLLLKRLKSKFLKWKVIKKVKLEMSRNKFGELVRKYIVDGKYLVYTMARLIKDKEDISVYQALNNMLNILYEKDDMGIEEAVDKMCIVTGLKKGPAKEIVLAHKKYKPKAIKWEHNKPENIEKYKKFREVVIGFCCTGYGFRAAFVCNDDDEAVMDMDGKIKELYAVMDMDGKIKELYDDYGIGEGQRPKIISGLADYIERSTSELEEGGLDYLEAATTMVRWHPFFMTSKDFRKEKAKMINTKKTVVVENAKKKTRGHDKYRFFIDKPGVEGIDTARVLKEAEVEGYDLVEIKNTKSGSSFIYGTRAIVNALDRVNPSKFNTAAPFESHTRKGWFLIDAMLTITELYEVIKKAEDNRTKIVVERYRVSSKG